MILTLAAILVLAWLLAVIARIGGGLVHVLLILALVALVLDRAVGRRRA